ncbi:hypothetical protein [Dactylosporangium sp. NPDC051541]|uniref:hypothetical protein n=1 Tax=Dactylosporangium sp. NPDC051541 TaxID=3363977 RepID=UPI003791544D
MQRLFDELIGTPPPAAIDTRALVRRDRRTRATYRAIGATATAGALGITAVLVTGTGGPSGAPPAPTAPPAAVGSPKPAPVVSTDTRFELTSATRAEAEQSAAKLAAALDDAVRTAVPGAAWVPGPGLEVTVIDYVSPPGWYGASDLRVDGHSGGLTAMAHTVPGFDGTCATLPAPFYPKGREPKTPPPPRPCQDVKTPGGAPAVVLTGDPGPGQRFELRTRLPAGRVLTLVVTGEPPVLTVDQALHVAQAVTERIR